jgi:hypothetical protein
MDWTERQRLNDELARSHDLCYKLLNSYMNLKEKFELLYSTVLNVNPGIIPLEIDPYREDEKELRKVLPPTHWTRRDWLDYNNNKDSE